MAKTIAAAAINPTMVPTMIFTLDFLLAEASSDLSSAFSMSERFCCFSSTADVISFSNVVFSSSDATKASALSVVVSGSLTDLAFFDSLGYSYTDNTKQNETQDSSDSIVYPHNTMYFDYTNPEKDTIGYGIGYKNVDFKDEGKYTYIGVAVRGSGYRSEWASNFTIGDSNDAYGLQIVLKVN